MKKLLLLGIFLLAAAAAHAEDDVYKSSNVVTNIQNVRQFVGRGTLKRLIVGVAGTGSSKVALWDGTSTTTFLRKIGNFDSTALRVIDFDVAISSGLVISSSGTATAADISIIYKSGSGL